MAAAEKEPGGNPASVDHLAHSHQNVTIMFMDIVGEEKWGGGAEGRRDCYGGSGTGGHHVHGCRGEG